MRKGGVVFFFYTTYVTYIADSGDFTNVCDSNGNSQKQVHWKIPAQNHENFAVFRQQRKIDHATEAILTLSLVKAELLISAES